jgi:hypothetical protein
LFGGQRLLFSADENAAFSCHGITCVGREVEQRGFQLIRIGLYPRQVLRQVDVQLDGRTERTKQQCAHALDQLLKVDRRLVQLLLAGEREHARTAA